MNSLKKGQITVFIILGLVLVVTLSLMFSIRDVAVQNDEYQITTNAAPLQSYIISCLEKVSSEQLSQISLQGGVLQLEEFMYYNLTKVAFFCMQKNSECVHSYLRIQDVENMLAKAIADNLDKCIDLQVFAKQGFGVRDGEKKATVKISDKKI